VTQIRPTLPPVAPPAQGVRAADAARLAAQKAFFQIAAGMAPAASATALPAAGPRTAAAAQRPAPIPAEPPARPLRPGSLLDIKV
jgi:hypothetical protein